MSGVPRWISHFWRIDVRIRLSARYTLDFVLRGVFVEVDVNFRGLQVSLYSLPYIERGKG